jgi:FkbM family methyltransferase
VPNSRQENALTVIQNMERLTAAIDEHRPEPLSTSEPVVIYGAGKTGREVLQYLELRGYEVAAILDQTAQTGASIGRTPVLPLGKWANANDPKGFQVIVAIHNRDTDISDIFIRLIEQGFARVISLVEFVNLFPDNQPSRYWLSPIELYRKSINEIELGMSALKDDLSTTNFLRILLFRITGNYDLSPSPSFNDQYVPKDLPRWQSPMRLIDCGAYDGESVLAIAREGYLQQAIATFEPDPANYPVLLRNLMGVESINIPCATGAQTSMCRFNTGLGEASAMGDDGTTSIQCVSLDDMLPAFGPTLIKMDVEGAEIESLQGAKNIIRRYRPDMAISLYHTPTDLWKIILLLNSWNLGYDLYIRCHGFNTFDSVLYAHPPASNTPLND